MLEFIQELFEVRKGAGLPVSGVEGIMHFGHSLPGDRQGVLQARYVLVHLLGRGI